MTWIKICGMKQKEDVLKAAELGANAVGFIFAPSPRRVLPGKIAELTHELKHITKIGVFVNSGIQEINEIRTRCQLDVIQLHGNESTGFCRTLGGMIIKAFRPKDEQDVTEISEYSNVWKILVDTYVPGQAGGTGQRMQTNILEKITDFSNIILAGGLAPDNVQPIINRYHPFGIDVNSGVETSPGVKDHNKMDQLFTSLKNEARNA